MRLSRLFGAGLASLAGGVLAVLTASTADATTVLKMSLEDTVREAELVVRGTVVAREPRIVQTPEGEDPRTYYTLQLTHTYVGEVKQETISLVNPGGVWVSPEIYADIPTGFPDHQVGEDLVLMLDDLQGSYAPVGLHQGKYFILANEEAGTTWATRMPGGSQLLDRQTHQPVSDFGQKMIFSIEELEAEIEAAAIVAGKPFHRVDRQQADAGAAPEEQPVQPAGEEDQP